jgi:hypothetical protein
VSARVLAALVVVAFFAGAASAADTSSTKVVRLTSVLTAAWLDDHGQEGVTPGDIFYERDDLFNAVAQLGKPKGAKVGSDTAKLTFSGSEVKLFGMARFGEGTITIEGGYAVDKQLRPVDANGKLLAQVDLPIVRGTGKWANAKGTVTVICRPIAENTYLNVYRIVLPTTA